MNTPVLKLPRTPVNWHLRLPLPSLVFCLLLALCSVAPTFIYNVDHTASIADQGTWLLILLSLLSFMMITGLAWWVLQHFWRVAGLTPLSQLFIHFNTLLLWQQFAFYWASFALLLLAASLSLIALC